MPRRSLLLHGPADALWRRRGRNPRGEKGDLDLPRGDQSRQGSDGRPALEPARPRFSVARGSVAQCVIIPGDDPPPVSPPPIPPPAWGGGLGRGPSRNEAAMN